MFTYFCHLCEIYLCTDDECILRPLYIHIYFRFGSSKQYNHDILVAGRPVYSQKLLRAFKYFREKLYDICMDSTLVSTIGKYTSKKSRKKVTIADVNCLKQRLFRFLLIKSEQFFKKSVSRSRDSWRERVTSTLVYRRFPGVSRQMWRQDVL